MRDNSETTKFVFAKDIDENPMRGVIRVVCDAMREKGYDPLNQLVGYIISGDPTYITSHNGARKLLLHVDRDELLEEIVGHYIKDLDI